jgi:ElaA protein
VDIVETRFNTTQIQISAQDYLLNFYQEFGFQSTGNSYLEDDIPHTEMRRN